MTIQCNEEKMRFNCRVTKERIHSHTHNILIPIAFFIHQWSYYFNSLCYSTLPVLFYTHILGKQCDRILQFINFLLKIISPDVI
jgi:hypothetical protein